MISNPVRFLFMPVSRLTDTELGLKLLLRAMARRQQRLLGILPHLRPSARCCGCLGWGVFLLSPSRLHVFPYLTPASTLTRSFI
jgi:hypothetical protein